MKKFLVSVSKKQFSNRQQLFLNDPNADVYALLRQKIYPLNMKFFTEVDFFSQADIETTKILMVDNSLDQTAFQSVIGYYYGKQLHFCRNWDIIPVLHVIHTLKATRLFNIILNDVKDNTDDYGFFLLVTIAQKYNIKWLKQLCQEDMILMGFEQLNFNRSDLMRVEKPILQSLIRQHQLYRINQNIIGLKQAQFKRIIKQYCTTNGLPDSNYNILCSQLLYQIAQQPQKPIELVRRSSEQAQVSILSSSTKMKSKTNTEKAEEELYKLRLLNSDIQEKGTKMIQQIQFVKTGVQNSCKLENEGKDKFEENSIQERFKKWQKVCQQQDAKFSLLKAQVQKMNTNLRKSDECSDKGASLGMNGSTNSTKDNQENVGNPRSRRMSQSESNLIPFMPVLSRDME